MKFCNKCNIEKQFTEFYKHKSHNDGLCSFCKDCQKIIDAANYIKFKEKKTKRNAEYYQENKEYFNILNRIWAIENPEAIRKIQRKYQHNNQIYYNDKFRKRKEKQQLATPKWIDLNLLEQIYINCPIGFQVDHIIPLSNKIMSGLNIPENLRYLPKKENQKKGNRLDSELKFELHPIKWQDIILQTKVS